MRGRRLALGPIFLIGFGLVFLAIGIVMATVAARQAGAEAARAERLRPLTVAALDDSQPGREALVEGYRSDRNPALFQQFVAYVREEYRGRDDNDRERWEEDERRTPPLLIDLVDGTVPLANDSYMLDSPPHIWQESQSSLAWNGFTGEGTKRYHGLRAGDAALAIGTLVAGPEGLELQAERVYGGTRSSYIAERQQTALWMPRIGAIFGVIGAALALLGIWWLVRRPRP
jgi:hypothetical protein